MRLILLTFVGVMICSCGHIEKKEAGKFLFSAQIDRWTKEGSFDFLLIKTTLTNKTPDTVKYVSMSCSWQDPYTTDTGELSILVSPCDRNVPKLIQIPPDKSEETILSLTSKKSIDQLQNIKFRIGFNLVTAKDQNEMFSKVSDLNKMKNVIWSDTLQLK